ncbi:MAG: restriction endonuclease [Pseudomonadota bacterium]
MSRRRKTGPIEDLMDAVALVPWWVSVALAPLLYLLMQHLASALGTGARAAPLADASELAMAAMTQGLAEASQVLLPAVCLLAAGVSVWRRRRRISQSDDTGAAPLARLLHGMSRQEFESLAGEAFRLRGFRVIETGRGGDDGVDLVLHKAGQTHLVHCGQWKALVVGEDSVRGLLQVMQARGAAVGWVLTAGGFTHEALRLAGLHPLRLIDGAQLKPMLDRAAIARQHRPVAPDMADTVPAWSRSSSLPPSGFH